MLAPLPSSTKCKGAWELNLKAIASGVPCQSAVRAISPPTRVSKKAMFSIVGINYMSCAACFVLLRALDVGAHGPRILTIAGAAMPDMGYSCFMNVAFTESTGPLACRLAS